MNRSKHSIALLTIATIPALSGCASDAYYHALEVQATARAAQPREAPQLVNHSWTDATGTTHTLVVNQPLCGTSNPLSEPTIPAPWEGPFRFFDRTLSTLERNLPWLFLFSARDSSNTTYSAQNGSTVNVSHGASSGIGTQGNSTVNTPDEEQQATNNETP